MASYVKWPETKQCGESYLRSNFLAMVVFQFLVKVDIENVLLGMG